MGVTRKNLCIALVLCFLSLFAEKQSSQTISPDEEEFSVNNDINNIQRLIALPDEKEEKNIKQTSTKRIIKKPIVSIKKVNKTDYLHYGTIVEIATHNPYVQSKVYVFPSNWMSPHKEPTDITQADYELRVGENPLSDTQCSSIGFQFFSLESSGKNSVIHYGDSCEIWAYSTSVIDGSPVGWAKTYNVIFPKPFIWYVSDKIAPNSKGNSVFATDPSRQDVTNGKQLFTIINPENLSDKGPIYQNSDVWIVSQNKQKDNIVIHESSDGSPWYVLEMQSRSDNSMPLGTFTISEVIAKNITGKAKIVYDRLIAQRIIKSPITPPDGYEKITGFFVDCFAAKVGTKTKMYAIDAAGLLYSINIDKKTGASAAPFSIMDTDKNLIKIAHGVQHNNCFLIVHKETKKVYEQNNITGDFSPVSITSGNDDIERIACAKTLASAYALGYSSSPGIHSIYHYASGWIQEINGLDVSIGTDGTVAIINASGKPMIRNSKTKSWDPMGKSSPSCTRIIVGSKKLIWVIDNNSSIWSFEKEAWSQIINKDGKIVTGFVSGGATSSDDLFLIASSGDAYYRTISSKDFKKNTKKKEKTLGQIRKERKK